MYSDSVSSLCPAFLLSGCFWEASVSSCVSGVPLSYCWAVKFPYVWTYHTIPYVHVWTYHNWSIHHSCPFNNKGNSCPLRDNFVVVVFPMFWLLGIKLLWTFVYEAFCENVFISISRKGADESYCKPKLKYKKWPIWFLKGLHQFTFLRQRMRVSLVLHLCQHFS